MFCPKPSVCRLGVPVADAHLRALALSKDSACCPQLHVVSLSGCPLPFSLASDPNLPLEISEHLLSSLVRTSPRQLRWGLARPLHCYLPPPLGTFPVSLPVSWKVLALRRRADLKDWVRCRRLNRKRWQVVGTAKKMGMKKTGSSQDGDLWISLLRVSSWDQTSATANASISQLGTSQCSKEPPRQS